MSYFNPTERIRKLANFPQLVGGVPPKTHRKCKDWASYTTAVDSVTREMVGELAACREAYAKLAKDNSVLASKLAEIVEDKADLERQKTRATVVAATHQIGLTPDDRALLEEATG